MPDVRFLRSLPLLALAALAVACTPVSTNPDAGPSDAGEEPSTPLEVIGAWADPFGGETEISEAAWGADAVVAFDNAANWAVVRSPDDAVWNPATFAKHVWTEPADGAFFVCTIEFGQATLEAARDTTKAADATDPANGGCGGFPWTRKTAALEIRGEWADDFGGETAITSHRWGPESVVKYANDPNFAITKAPGDAPWNPNTFSKQVWTELVDGSFWTCTIDFGKATAAEAEATPNVADASDPATGGCNGFGWTRMTPALAIRGAWFDGWSDFTVSSFAWGSASVVDYDNGTRWVVTRNAADDEWAPGKFAKQAWTWHEGALWHCTVDFGLDTAEQARGTTKVADPADPASGGCGGFPWSKLVASLEVAGEWVVDDESFVISSARFGLDDVRSFDNGANTAILQHPSDGGVPGLFAKVQWTDPAEGGFHACIVADELASLDEAKAAAEGDPTDLTAGCRGGAWTAFARPQVMP